MPLPVMLDSVRFFLRLLLAVVLLSASVSKLAHPHQFSASSRNIRSCHPGYKRSVGSGSCWLLLSPWLNCWQVLG